MAKTTPVPGIPTATGAASVLRTLVPTTTIVPDEGNRRVIEDDDFEALCDSIQVLGVLQPVQVWRRPDGTHRLIDGERRWRAAQKVGLAEIACDVWPGEADPRRVALAGLVLNEHRRAHGCLHVARRLRDIKNDAGLSHSEVAAQTGLPLDRVKTYFSLFGASDHVLTFLEEKDVALKVAVEMVRYEKATNEARARRLLERHQESPLTVHEIVALRKRATKAREEDGHEKTDSHGRPASRVIERLEDVVRRHPTALAELAQRFGYRLVPLDSERKGA